MTHRRNLPPLQEDPDAHPESRAMAEYIVLLFVALALIVILTAFVLHLLNGFYSELFGNTPN